MDQAYFHTFCTFVADTEKCIYVGILYMVYTVTVMHAYLLSIETLMYRVGSAIPSTTMNRVLLRTPSPSLTSNVPMLKLTLVLESETIEKKNS